MAAAPIPKPISSVADALVSQALALDPEYANAHLCKANILMVEGRYDEAVAEDERTLALDPSLVDAYEGLGLGLLFLGQYEKSLELFDKAIRLSPHDPILHYWYTDKASAYFGLKQYDLAIEWARRSLAINPNYWLSHGTLIAALVLTDHEEEAREALQRYLALPPAGARTIAAWTALKALHSNPRSDAIALDYWDRSIEALRKAGMPEQ